MRTALTKSFVKESENKPRQTPYFEAMKFKNIRTKFEFDKSNQSQSKKNILNSKKFDAICALLDEKYIEAKHRKKSIQFKTKD